MEEQTKPQQTWWQKNIRFLIIAAVVIGFIVFALAVILFGWDWTGFNGGYSQVTTHTPTKDTVLPPAKTLWDWLQLLIIPLVLAIGGFWFSQIQKDRDQKAAERAAQTEREIAQDNQQEATVQEYINKMSELLLDEELCKSTAKEEARKIARVRTLTVFPRLNGKRKGTVLQFLYEAQLINKGDRIVDLSGANLSGASLSGTNLSRTNLSGTNLSEADLSGANLSEAVLSKANLSGANLSSITSSYELSDLSGKSASVSIKAWVIQVKASIYIYTTNLAKADLSQANLSKANLRDANLSEANLSGAYLEKADLSKATVDPKQLDMAESMKGATMPDGSKHLW